MPLLSLSEMRFALCPRFGSSLCHLASLVILIMGICCVNYQTDKQTLAISCESSLTTCHFHLKNRRDAKFEDSLRLYWKKNGSLSPEFTWLAPYCDKEGKSSCYHGYTYNDLHDKRTCTYYPSKGRGYQNEATESK